MFYERYVSLCTREKISPSTAAVKAGFNKGTVSVWKKKYEAGQDVVPEQEIIDKICAFFGCSESWLRGIEKAPTQEGERIPHSALREYLVGQGVRILLDTDAKVTEQTIVNTLRKLSELQEQNDK